MKNYMYILIEAALSIIILILILGLLVFEFNILILGLSLIGSLYFIGKIVLGFKLILDIINGSQEIEAIFMGNLGVEHLDFFWKIKFSNVYFDDAAFDKNYFLFDDSCSEDIFPGNKVMLVYYKRSRIILQMHHCEA